MLLLISKDFEDGGEFKNQLSSHLLYFQKEKKLYNQLITRYFLPSKFYSASQLVILTPKHYHK
jgi:hypothetical protein